MGINGIAANYYQMGYTNNQATKAGKSFVEIASQKAAESDKETTQETTFTEKVAETGIASQSVSKTRNVGTVSTEDMTMEEYKQYIYDRISQMTMNPSRMQDTISINISAAGFKAMKNDPEYEKWVLDYLQKDFNETVINPPAELGRLPDA